MSDATLPILEVRDLVKEYRLHQEKRVSLREMAKRGFLSTNKTEAFRALDGVSLNLQRGESVAIMGSNGSGKSTLMKIIAGVTHATSGEVITRGRVVALLEVGSAFQDEYTGLENIYLQCSMMGLTRAETEARLGKIIDFAELGDFLNTPVKRYSSGMFMRLAFAVASSVDPELLIVDEVFAVGDPPFQEKCHRRIDELRSAGTSILLVTHSYHQAAMIASRAIWLEKGRIHMEGPIEKVLTAYYRAERGLAYQTERSEDRRVITLSPMLRTTQSGARIERFDFLDSQGHPVTAVAEQEPLVFEAEILVMEPSDGLALNVAATSLDRVRTFSLNHRHLITPATPGTYRIRFELAEHKIPAGFYQLGLALYDPKDMENHIDLILRERIVCVYTQDDDRARLEKGYTESRPPGRFLVPNA